MALLGATRAQTSGLAQYHGAVGVRKNGDLRKCPVFKVKLHENLAPKEGQSGARHVAYGIVNLSVVLWFILPGSLVVIKWLLGWIHKYPVLHTSYCYLSSLTKQRLGGGRTWNLPCVLCPFCIHDSTAGSRASGGC